MDRYENTKLVQKTKNNTKITSRATTIYSSIPTLHLYTAYVDVASQQASRSQAERQQGRWWWCRWLGRS